MPDILFEAPTGITRRFRDMGDGTFAEVIAIDGAAGGAPSLPAGAATEATLAAASAKLPATLGPKTSAASLSVTPAMDAVTVVGGLSANPSAMFTRPADTTAYASGDLVANSTTAGAVVPLSLTAARVAAGGFLLHRLLLRKSGTSTTNAAFRVHLFGAAPTVTAGDNGVLAMSGSASYLGQVDITMTQAFTDGAVGMSDFTMSDMIVRLGAGQSLYALIEARGAYTPASGETFALVADIAQD